MSVGQGLEVLQWLLIALLTLALAGVVRLIRLIDQRVTEGIGEPRRLQVGDHVQLPDHVQKTVGSTGKLIVLFASASCSSCRRAFERLHQSVPAEVGFVSLWRDRVPDYAFNPTSLAEQLAVFDQLRVGVTPFALMLEHNVVRARGGIGSGVALEKFESTIIAIGNSRGGDRAPITQ